MPERQLLLGGPYNRIRPGYQKIPRFVPTEIRRDITFDMNSFRISETDGDMCPHEVETTVLWKQSLELTFPKEEMDSRRATRATSEMFPPTENLPITKAGEQDAENRVFKKLQNRSAQFCQYVWRWLRKHRDNGGCGGAENPVAASQIDSPVSSRAVETTS